VREKKTISLSISFLNIVIYGILMNNFKIKYNTKLTFLKTWRCDFISIL